VIDGMLEPALLLLLPHEAPHFVDLGFVHALEDNRTVARLQGLDQGLVDRGERKPFFSTP
jgi:hypothetical protein